MDRDESGPDLLRMPGTLDTIVVGGEYYIRASAQNVIHQRVSIKHGDSFVLSDRRGDLPSGPGMETGLFVGGTRHLSVLELRLEGEKPPLLSSSLSDDDVTLTSVQTNPNITVEGGVRIPKDAVLVQRELAVADGRLHERIAVESFHLAPVRITLRIALAVDFVDIFEVRGYRRKARGTTLAVEVAADGLTFAYMGLDDVLRRTVVRVSPPPTSIDADGMTFTLNLAPHAPQVIDLVASGGEAGLVTPIPPDTNKAVTRVRRENAQWDKTATHVFTSSENVNALLERAFADVRLMCTRTAEGIIPYAGIPWYACPFGRDSLWTSLMTLSLQPRIAAGTLRYLAKRQATTFDDFTDSDPGKVLHEMRTGEMANLREIPFVPYYGSVDATPLFVVLLDRYVAWTGDADLADSLWENALAALRWVRGAADLDGDGFLEYQRRSPAGLSNQGWKDSSDCIFHTGGELAKGPIALVEVQAYAYAALRSGARLARMLADDALARELDSEARILRDRFDERFWSDTLGTYALALDGAKAPCEISTSNAGHALWSGIAGEGRAAKVAKRLLGRDLFSGWGIRTLAEGEARYNPMSYHNGSIWPHDNAIIAEGLKRYDYRDEAARVASAILEASLLFDDNRVPELFCGFPRSPRHSPVPYPVACRPQAWSAATIFHLLETLLGLEVDGRAQRATFVKPALPPSIDWIEITNLAVGAKRTSLRLERTRMGGAVLARSRGDAKIVIKK